MSRAAAATVAGLAGLAGIAGAISYSLMRELAEQHGQAGWHAGGVRTTRRYRIPFLHHLSPLCWRRAPRSRQRCGNGAVVEQAISMPWRQGGTDEDGVRE